MRISHFLLLNKIKVIMRKNIKSIVLKVASRCNLNCTYCYMYNLGDTTYLQQPKFFSTRLQDQLLKRIKEHVIENNLKYFIIVFHGGEPLLYSKKKYYRFKEKAADVFKNLKDFKLFLYLQTNGVLIDDEWCKVFKELDINVGISIDGTKKVHDMFRIDHKGKGSYDDVVKGIAVYKKHFPTIGVISVININENPKDTYHNYKKIGITGCNLLFPDNNYDSPPIMWGIKSMDEYNLEISKWLIELYEVWKNDDPDTRLSIRLFETLIRLILGDETSGNELYGVQDNGVIVIETNGDIETVDTLKSCGNGFTKGHHNIENNSFTEVLETPLVDLYYKSHKRLCDKCNSCPILDVCGGGYITHRYSSFNGFNNPSIYCEDYINLITYVQNDLFKKFSQEDLEDIGVELLDINTINDIINTGIISFDSGATENDKLFLESFKK